MSQHRDRTDTTLPKIIEALGGQTAYDALPPIPQTITDEDYSPYVTGYVNICPPKGLKDPIMKGTDPHGRPFIVFCIECNGRLWFEAIRRLYATGATWASCASLLKIQSAPNSCIEDIRRLVAGDVISSSDSRIGPPNKLADFKLAEIDQSE